MRTLWILLVCAALAVTPTCAQEDPTTARGFEPDKVFQLGELDHVNVFNGNLPGFTMWPASSLWILGRVLT